MYIGKLLSVTPTLNFASRAMAETGEYWGPRTIPDWQLFSVITGEARLQLGPERFRIRPGECVFYGPDSPHILSITRPTQYFSFHFSWHEVSPEPIHPAFRIRNVSSEAMKKKAESCRISVHNGGDIEIPHHFSIVGLDSIMTRMFKEYQDELEAYPYALRALLMELLTVLVRHLACRSKGLLLSKIEPALAAMREQPARKWSVSELAELCGYHPSYFTGLFCREVGQNPKEYLIAERIKQAKAALLKGEPVEQIAQSLGYASIHYFSNNFKKETDLTPSEFKQLPTAVRTPDVLRS
ncbi:AraC family transcriptional regulator [Paenibacillus solisilvae]|uniref:AraC family transcriptional regulator n=1 Tax=Paenibacillus solisilvae TaxID=2486751 RepID=A0ABW0VWR2_9BACL